MITFYIYKTPTPDALGTYLLTLSGKIHIHCQDKIQAEKISKTLWSYPNRFIPHMLSDTAHPHMITLGYHTPPECDHLINVSETILEVPHIEWVDKNIEGARERYKTYKSKGHALDTKML